MLRCVKLGEKEQNCVLLGKFDTFFLSVVPDSPPHRQPPRARSSSRLRAYTYLDNLSSAIRYSAAPFPFDAACSGVVQCLCVENWLGPKQIGERTMLQRTKDGMVFGYWRTEKRVYVWNWYDWNVWLWNAFAHSVTGEHLA